MIETEIRILINRKSDIDAIKKSIVDSEIQFPVYIMEYDNHYEIRFESDYEEWELDTRILNSFSDFEFTTDLENGKKEIRLQISRSQSEMSTDGWGKPIEDPLEETKYLVRKSAPKSKRFNTIVQVLFKDHQESYQIKIIDGITPKTGEKGFLLVNNFNSHEEYNKEDVLVDCLYKTPVEAFNHGYYKMQKTVNQDFAEYIKSQKKELSKLHTVPRKIIRDFIGSCNKSDLEGILKNLDENVVFEKRIHWQTKENVNGIEEMKGYLLTQNHELFARDFKIRSSWDIKLPVIRIGIKYYPTSSVDENNRILKNSWITFKLQNNRILGITVDW